MGNQLFRLLRRRKVTVAYLPGKFLVQRAYCFARPLPAAFAKPLINEFFKGTGQSQRPVLRASGEMITTKPGGFFIQNVFQIRFPANTAPHKHLGFALLQGFKQLPNHNLTQWSARISHEPAVKDDQLSNFWSKKCFITNFNWKMTILNTRCEQGNRL